VVRTDLPVLRPKYRRAWSPRPGALSVSKPDSGPGKPQIPTGIHIGLSNFLLLAPISGRILGASDRSSRGQRGGSDKSRSGRIRDGGCLETVRNLLERCFSTIGHLLAQAHLQQPLYSLSFFTKNYAPFASNKNLTHERKETFQICHA
jgi:hypothetical protein